MDKERGLFVVLEKEAKESEIPLEVLALKERLESVERDLLKILELPVNADLDYFICLSKDGGRTISARIDPRTMMALSKLCREEAIKTVFGG